MADQIGSLYVNITGKTTELEQSLGKTKSAMTGFKNGIGDVTKSLTGFSLSQIGAAAAVAGVAKFVQSSVREYSDYALSIEKITRLTGDSAEETSRLVQVGDDLRISQGEIAAALQAGARKGIDTSIQGIANLSDEYLKLNPGMERSQFLMENFGRSGMSMAKMMEQGSAKIKDMSAAVNDNLVVTQKGIQDANNYALAVDDLTDAWTGFKNVIGSTVLPVLTDLINGVNYQVDYQAELGNIVAKSGKDWMHFSQAEKDAAIAQAQLNVVIANGKDTIDGASDSFWRFNSSVVTSTEALENFNKTPVVGKSLPGSLIGVPTDDQKMWYETHAARDVSPGDIAKYSTQPTPVKVDTTSLQEASALSGDVVRFLKEVPPLTKPKVEMAEPAMSNTLGDMKAAVDYFNSLTSKSIVITTVHRDVYSSTKLENSTPDWMTGSAWGATGLDMTVPPGYPGDSFTIGASSGEHVKISTAADKSTAGGGVTNNYYAPVTHVINNKTAYEQMLRESVI